MTGCHVGVCLKNPFTFEGSRQAKTSGCLFFLGTSFLDKQKRSTSPVKGETIPKSRNTRLTGTQDLSPCQDSK